jgi:hypothetical protein
LIPPKLDLCALIVEKNAKEDDGILEFTDEDERTAATLLTTGALSSKARWIWPPQGRVIPRN